ncbi:MAG: hypothetical protein M0C28_42450 [Candidatus Moduliflexus flocculans]|nr:hypothetical protein [Candidatus Moduliflexus flocculans]
MVFTYKGEDIADTLLRFAAEYRVGHIVVGRALPRPLWKRIGRNKSVVADLVRNARKVTVIVLDTSEDRQVSVGPRPDRRRNPRSPMEPAAGSGIRPIDRPRLSLDDFSTECRDLGVGGREGDRSQGPGLDRRKGSR